MFLGVSSVAEKIYFRWYDKQTNSNIQFLMFLFFVLYPKRLNRRLEIQYRILGVNFWYSDLFGFCWKP